MKAVYIFSMKQKNMHTTTGTKQWEISGRKGARTKRTHTYWQVL